jgi:putative ABC transport system ATP-binding protein
MTAIEANDLYRFFHVGDDETLALKGVSISVESGEVVAVTGPSGSGKSTLLNCLAGLDEPDGGMVRIAGSPLSRRTEEERTRLRSSSIGMLFQSVNLVQHLDVNGNVALAQQLARKRDAVRAKSIVERVGLQERAGALPAQLSGGELARAGLAVALANDPPVLLADEPTGELDHGTAKRILGLLRTCAEDGCAVVIVTHSPDVSAWSDRTVELSDGAVVA